MLFRKTHSLRQRFVIPILAIVIVQALLYGFVFIRMSVLNEIDDNAYQMLFQYTSSRRLALETQLVRRYSNLDMANANILQSLADTLAEQGKEIKDFREDADLAQQAVSDAANHIIYLLRTNNVTGAFFVLDAPGIAGDVQGTSRAGIYIRDLDPAAYAADNSDLLLERAMPSLTKTLHLPLDSYWSSTFHIKGDDAVEEYYFTKPIAAALEHPKKDATELGYWSPLFSLPDNNCNVITYTQPLITAEGEVIGVLGIDLTEKYLLSHFDTSELGLGRDASYVLGRMQQRDRTLAPYLVSGSYAAQAGEFALNYNPHPSSYSVSAEGEDMIANIAPLQLYNADSPFVGDKWVISAVVSQDRLLRFSNDMRNMTYLSIALSLVCAVIALLIISQMVTRPIMRLAHNLAQSDPTQPLLLPKLKINEIDQLSSAIVDLSSAVAASASKFSEIIHLSGLPVGVFEHVDGSPSAFCSRTMCRLLNWSDAGDTDMLLPIEDFNSRMKYLESYLSAEDNGKLYCLPHGEEGKQTRWLRVQQLYKDGTLLGSVFDVTQDILEKQKIQYERDYDQLSHLYNRRAFERELDMLFHDPAQLKIAALVMWDLDNLKYLNDTFGHDCGDQYIAAFASLLTIGAPPSSHYVTARRSGDEFYAFFHGYETVEALNYDVEQLYSRISVATLMLPTGTRYRMRASGGISYYPKDAQTPNELIHFADFAMYRVKHTVKGNLEAFEREQYDQNIVLLHGQDALDRLIDREQVRYALQPILNVHTCEIFGYELLMRPQLPELSSAGDVLRLARSHSKLRQIERLTLFKGMETFESLDKAGKLAPDSRVFINSVASQLLSPEDEKAFLERYQSYFPRLVLEITENDPYDTEITKHKIELVHEFGGMVALDDYGSGYNSDAILLFLSPECIKVDLSIIRDIHKDVNRQSVLKYLVSYAKPRGIRVLAEGVETLEELTYVVQNGVDLLQGFYIAMPAFEPDPISPQVLEFVRQAHPKATPPDDDTTRKNE